MAFLLNSLPALGASLSSSLCSRPCGCCLVTTSHLAIHRIGRSRNTNARRICIVTDAHNGADSDKKSVDADGDRLSGVIPWRLGLQSLIVIFVFGFIDAGYSGDWSRIGVLSQEAESTLRLASYGVVPVSLVLVWLISKGKSF